MNWRAAWRTKRQLSVRRWGEILPPSPAPVRRVEWVLHWEAYYVQGFAAV